MTIATKTRNVAGWAILVCLVAGCSSGAEAGDAADAPAQLNEAGYISVPESADDPGYCGYRSLGLDAQGHESVDQERYYYGVMNRLLTEDVELQRAVRLTQVTKCDEGRQFVRVYNDYQRERPTSAEEKAALIEAFPVGEPEAPKVDPNAPIEKIFNGTEAAIAEVVEFGFQDEKGRGMNCTAIRLAGTVFLTAAHCLVIQDRAAGEHASISFPITTLKHVVDGQADGQLYPAASASRCTGLKPGERCPVLQMDGYMNPNYVGTNDRINDVAVLHVRNDSQKGLRNASSAATDFGNDVGWLATATPQPGDMVQSAGWGPDGARDRLAPRDGWVMRIAKKLPVDQVDGTKVSKVKGIYQGTWFSTIAESGAQICRGDSGGPAYNDRRLVMGVTSLLSAHGADNCASIGASQFMSRTDWQAFDFIPRAMYALQKASDTQMCRCVFHPAVTGVKDPEAPGAHVRCNEGCEDPEDWTE